MIILNKIISLKPIDQLNQKKLFFFQQIEFLTHWINEITSESHPQAKSIKNTIEELISIKQDIETNSDMNTEWINESLTKIHINCLECCQLTGFKTIEQIIFIELGFQGHLNFQINV